MALAFALMAGSCSDEATPVIPPTPVITPDAKVDLQVRAMVRAWGGVTEPVCVPEEWRAHSTELDAAFGLAVEYFESPEDLATESSSDYRCLALSPQGISHVTRGVVGIVVWAERGDLNGIAEIQMFRWDGSEWVDTTAEEVGVTVTSSVS